MRIGVAHTKLREPFWGADGASHGAETALLSFVCNRSLLGVTVEIRLDIII